MNELAMSGVIGLASLVCVALSWRAPNSRRLLLAVATLVNFLAGASLPSEADQARLVSWSVCGALIAIGMIMTRREHWRGPSLILWGLVLVLLAASYFLTDVPATLQLGLLIALAVTTGLALLSSLLLVIRLARTDKTQRA